MTSTAPKSAGFWACGVVVLLALAAYGDSFTGPFVLDDGSSITGNPTIHRLWPLSIPLSPPHGDGQTVEGRPVLNGSLALNYAIGGTAVGGYHALNLIIHLLAGLTLFGIVRRTLAPASQRVEDPALPPTLFAFAVALLWTLHPLQTESVTYIIQRAESLMGLFYLLTLYGFIRYADADGEAEARRPPLRDGSGGRLASVSTGWAVFSVLACLFGMATKEVMVSAPVIVLLYDRTFVAGTFRAAWQLRRKLYLALASTWILLAVLVFQTGSRGGTSGPGSGVGVGTYWPTQFPAIVRYLRLAVWPHPLVFDYGTEWVHASAALWLSAAAVIGLLGLTVFAVLRPCTLAGGRVSMRALVVERVVPNALSDVASRTSALGTTRSTPARIGHDPQAIGRAPGRQPGLPRNAIGFLGLWFFAILAPTSLVPGNRQTMAEHRMYLALIPLIVLGVMGLAALLRRCRPGRRPGRPVIGLAHPSTAVFAVAVLVLAAAFAILTARRNRDYRSLLTLYADTVDKAPGNAFAQNNLGVALFAAGRVPEAIGHDREAIRLWPGYAVAHNNLGSALLHLGRVPEAAGQFEEALRLKPEFEAAHANLGTALVGLGRVSEALAQFGAALRLDPGSAETHNNLGNALLRAGRGPEAIAQYREALRLAPGYAEADSDLGSALCAEGRRTEALPYFEAALRLDPRYAPAHYNFGNALLGLSRLPEAITQFRAAIQLEPDAPAAHDNLGNALLRLDRVAEAVDQYEETIRLDPGHAVAHYNLGNALLRLGRQPEAIAQFREALRLRPDFPQARQMLVRLDRAPPE